MSRRSQYAPGAYGQQPSNIAHGLLDPALTIGGGLLGSTVGGLMALPVWAMEGPDEAQMMLEAAQNRASYVPETEAGQQSTQAVFDTLGTIAQPLEAMTQATGNFAYEHAPEGYEAAFGTAGLLAPDAIGAAIGLPYALKAGRKLNQATKHLRLDPKPMPINPFSREQGIIAGPKANNADLGLLKKAEDMKKQGVKPDLIYAETKWWLDHPDGKPRFEIDDKDFVVNNYRPTGGGIDPSHPGIKANYDKSYNLRVKTHPKLDGQAAYKPPTSDEAMFGGQGAILIPENDIPPRSTFGHELQHYVQQREGTSRGGSPAMFKDKDITSDLINPIDKRINELFNVNPEFAKMQRKFNVNMSDIKDKYGYLTLDSRGNGRTALNWGDVPKDIYNKHMKMLDDLQKFPERNDYFNLDMKRYRLQQNENVLSPHDQYLNLAGEAEARMVQDRLNMSMDERMIDPFYDNYKVPFEDMIIRQGLLE